MPTASRPPCLFFLISTAGPHRLRVRWRRSPSSTCWRRRLASSLSSSRERTIPQAGSLPGILRERADNMAMCAIETGMSSLHLLQSPFFHACLHIQGLLGSVRVPLQLPRLRPSHHLRSEHFLVQNQQRYPCESYFGVNAYLHKVLAAVGHKSYIYKILCRPSVFS